MNSSLFLVYCTEILGLLLFIPGYTGASQTSGNNETTIHSNRQNQSNTSNSTESAQVSTGLSSPTSLRPQSTTISTAFTTRATTTTRNLAFYKSECRPLFMVSGILIIACTILLISTLILLYKVCQLSRRLKTLSGNDELITNSEYWMGTDKRSKSKSETEAKETTVLMADLNQTQEETNNGTIKEDGEKVKEEEQTAEEKEVGEIANSEEASATPVTMAENSSSTKPQEETTDSQSNKAVEAASSEGKEEPDVEEK